MKRILSNTFIILLMVFFLAVGALERHFHPHLTYESKEKHFFKEDVFTNRLVPFLPFSSFPMFSDNLDNGKVSELFIVGVYPNGEKRKIDLSQYGPFWDRGYQLSLQNAVLSGKEVSEHAEILFDLIQESRAYKFEVLKIVYGVYDFQSWVEMKKSGESSLVMVEEQDLYKKVY